jgi:hypothetical protein
VNELGVCTLWIKSAEGVQIEKPQDQTAAEQEQHVVILQVVMENGLSIKVLFRREDFSKMLAFPNEADPTEVAVNLEE